jgi:dolichyl-diphosphooligosaccharide--protein glycosyltransferase
MVFAGVGAWLLFQKKVNHSMKIKGEMAVFALIIGILGVYFSSAFVRLEVFGSISIIILASIGISILISKILKVLQKPPSAAIKISFLAVIVILLMVPMVYPEKLNWSNNNVGIPISVLHAGTKFDVSTNDWTEAMKWVKENTPKDAVFASWWDYGYWISTLGERTTLSDNATLIDWQIRKIAAMYFSTSDNAWQILTADAETDVSSSYVSLPTDVTDPYRHGDGVYDKYEEKLDQFKKWKDSSEKIYDPDVAAKYSTLFDYWESELYVYPPILTGLDADYILINLAVEKLSAENILPMYTIRQNGGDETKAYWFIKIADLPIRDYYNPEFTSYTDKFWNETLLGQLIPFSVLTYVDPNDTSIQSETFKPGYTAIYVKDIKFPADSDGPFQMVYVSPSFGNAKGDDVMLGAVIYKINKDYNPNQ